MTMKALLLLLFFLALATGVGFGQMVYLSDTPKTFGWDATPWLEGYGKNCDGVVILGRYLEYELQLVRDGTGEVFTYLTRETTLLVPIPTPVGQYSVKVRTKLKNQDGQQVVFCSDQQPVISDWCEANSPCGMLMTGVNGPWKINYTSDIPVPSVPQNVRLVSSDQQPPVPPQNILTNGDFEVGFTNGIANGWIPMTDGGTGYSYLQDVGRVGGSSQKVVVDSFLSWGIVIYQTPPMELNKWYTISGWYKNLNGTVSLQVCKDDYSVKVFNQELVDSSNAWVFFTFDFQWTDAQADQVRFAPGIGTFWFDDVKLVAKP